MYLYVKYTKQSWGRSRSFFFFLSEKIVGNIDLSKYKREDTSHDVLIIPNLPNRKMDLLFYSKIMKASIFRKGSYVLYIRSFRKMKASPFLAIMSV